MGSHGQNDIRQLQGSEVTDTRRIDDPDVEITVAKDADENGTPEITFVGKAVGSGSFELSETGGTITAKGAGGDAGDADAGDADAGDAVVPADTGSCHCGNNLIDEETPCATEAYCDTNGFPGPCGGNPGCPCYNCASVSDGGFCCEDST